MIVYVEVVDEYPTFVVRSDEFHYTTRVDIPEEVLRTYVLARDAYVDAKELLVPYVKIGKKLGAIPRRRSPLIQHSEFV